MGSDFWNKFAKVLVGGWWGAGLVGVGCAPVGEGGWGLPVCGATRAMRVVRMCETWNETVKCNKTGG